MPSANSNPDRETLMMLISAYLDGELSAAEQAQVENALAQDPELLEFFEQLSAGTGIGAARLSHDDADALTASVLAATTEEVPASVEGAFQLASMAVDGCLDDRGAAQLDALLEKPASAVAVAGFVASAEAMQAGTRAVAQVSSVQSTLASLPDHVSAAVAVHERIGELSSAALDDALTPNEANELAQLLPRAPDVAQSIASSVHVGEALRVASSAPAFAKAGAKAGEAALHAIEAERLRQRTNSAQHAPSERPSFIGRALEIFRGVRAPLAFAMGAAALFFAINGRPEAAGEKPDVEEELIQILAKQIELEPVKKADLPLLADNTADVEALDATATTMVFSTESSNITVIWLADADDVGSEQGT